MSLNGRQHMRNLLQIVVGGSGAGKTRLVFCHFSLTPARAEVRIPEHASEMLGIPAGCVSVSAGPSDATILVYP